MTIPVVIVHTGAQLYFENCIRICKKTNPVLYIIGDETNIHLAAKYDVSHVPIKSLGTTTAIEDFKLNYKHLSTLSPSFEQICFLRMFWVDLFMKKFGFEQVFHLDSDCILLTDINSLHFNAPSAISICQDYGNEHRMTSSVHNALLHTSFLSAFKTLCHDIYVSREKFTLILPKSIHHRKNNLPGGICDMTIYYLIVKTSGLEVQNLQEQFNGGIFLNNIASGEGPLSKTQYKKDNTGQFCEIIDKNGEKYVHDTITNKLVRLHSIHYSGVAKRLLEKL